MTSQHKYHIRAMEEMHNILLQYGTKYFTSARETATKFQRKHNHEKLIRYNADCIINTILLREETIPAYPMQSQYITLPVVHDRSTDPTLIMKHMLDIILRYYPEYGEIFSKVILDYDIQYKVLAFDRYSIDVRFVSIHKLRECKRNLCAYMGIYPDDYPIFQVMGLSPNQLNSTTQHINLL